MECTILFQVVTSCIEEHEVPSNQKQMMVKGYLHCGESTKHIIKVGCKYQISIAMLLPSL